MKFLEFYRLNEAKPVGDKNKELWLDYLKKNYSDKDVSDLFVSFVSVDKIGINPKSTFKTPNGVYTYPMKFLLDEIFVPFRGMNKPKKIKILKAVSDKVLDHSLSNKKYKIVVYELIKKYRDRFDVNNIEKYLEDFEEMNSDENNYKKLWKLTFQIKTNSNDWSKMLIDLGFDWSNDKGEGIIHPSEPTQAVFLNPKSYKVVDEEFVDTEQRYKDRNKPIDMDLIINDLREYSMSDQDNMLNYLKFYSDKILSSKFKSNEQLKLFCNTIIRSLIRDNDVNEQKILKIFKILSPIFIQFVHSFDINSYGFLNNIRNKHSSVIKFLNVYDDIDPGYIENKLLNSLSSKNYSTEMFNYVDEYHILHSTDGIYKNVIRKLIDKKDIDIFDEFPTAIIMDISKNYKDELIKIYKERNEEFPKYMIKYLDVEK